MQKKKMYKCEFTNYDYIKEGENRQINLEYYMLLNEEKEMYGIEILKKEKSNISNDEIIESNSIINYSADENKVTNIINELGKGKVTPVSLYDVMENFN